jgi:murein DD-endopeptidase MepM/ murein hydrolase activator NlpD
VKNETEKAGQKPKRILSLRFLFFILLVAALVPVAFAGWSELYAGFLEHSEPQIEVLQFPRGVGLAPVSIKLRLTDQGAGLDEVVVRTTQKGNAREILRQSLGGQQATEITVEFPGDKSALEEGAAEFEVRAFDRSFWNNRAIKTFPLKVDYRRPKVEVLTGQHNARVGGAQLIIYRATDESLALSGIKVGGTSFLGYPARGLDKDLDDRSLFVALYAFDQFQDPNKTPIRVFAEDEVGNAVSAQFYNKVQPRPERVLGVPLTEDVLLNSVAPLADEYLPKLIEAAKQSGQQLVVNNKKGGKERLLEKLAIVNKNLRVYSENEISGMLKAPRFERFWFQPFVRQVGVVQFGFSDELRYIVEGKEVAQTRANGFEIAMQRDQGDVVAASDGIIIFADSIGTYGNLVAIDHGLGLVSLYGHLSAARVKRGDQVKAGQVIGVAGRSGFSRNSNLFFQVRVHGIPVDPTEWSDRNWFYAHVNAKIDEVKQLLGIPIYRTVE